MVAKKLGWPEVKGNGLGSLAQSFITKSSLPNALHMSFRPLANYRSREGDAHGHASRIETPEEVAKYFIANAASLILLVQSEVK